jgi:subfamily B ATP-binding cassette protein MsbA
MRNYFRLLKYLRRHWQKFSLGFVLMLLNTVLGGISITMLYPVLTKLNEPSEMRIYEQRAILPQIGEEWNRSIPEDFSFTSASLAKLGENLQTNFLDLLRRNEPGKILSFLCLVFFIVLFLKALALYFYHYIFGILEELFSKEMRDELFFKINRFSLSFYDKFRTGDIISRMVSDIEFLKKVIVENIAELISNLFQVIQYIAIAMLINLKLTLFVLIVVPPIALILNYIAKQLKKYSYRSQVKAAGIINVLEESITAFKIIAAFVRHQFQQQKFEQETFNYYRARLKTVKYNMMNRPMSEFLSSAIGVVIFWYGGNLILQPNSTLSVAGFLVYFAALYSAFQPLRTLSRIYNEAQKGLGVALRYFEIFDQEPDIRSPENALVFPGLKEKIVFENVSFSYDGKNKALDNINLAIKKGEVIALVGASGGGKTTLTNMIPRFYDPTEGRILFDEFDLRQLELSSLRRSIGIVTQETMLFHDTVFNNIAFGSPETPREKVGTVAKFANAHDFILALPQGYETIIGERGSRLSGGQRQRLAIARAIINDPEILIFDEATSSLDSEAEKLIQEALEKIIIGRTVIIIAHRLSTVRFAHRILVIENGKIAEEGVHSELMAKNGSYRKLYDLQYWVNDKTSL